jgi:cellulose synthase/poly-beta-1,6-N-acetylglucosamine synthase-like glycosyltransferase
MYFDLVAYATFFIGLYVSIFFLLLYLKYRSEIPEEKKTDWEPFISVIIPAYNEERGIRNCILSILNSDYKNLEVIVIDDGSTDNTYGAACSISNPRFKVLRKSNSGKAASMNFGILHAKGELIATMDADSYVEKDTINKLIPLFDSDDVAAVTAAVKVRPSKSWIREFQRVEYLFMLFTRRILSFIDAVSVTPGPFSIFRSWVFERLGGFDEDNIVEDHEIALRIQSNHYKIRSSLTADVYTDVPDEWGSLIKQRVRWHRGGMHNIFRYRHLINPKYGDLGIFVLPLTAIGCVLVFVLAFKFLGSVFFPGFYAQRLGTGALPLILDPLSIIFFLVSLVSLVWAFSVLNSFKDQKVSFPLLFVYLVVYWYFMLAYNCAMVLKELKREKFTW